ncbi:hypothetical protein F4554_000144 [Actinopolymorpha rutila]|uniref:Uncharacterized protein n=1 Tax=Actinopolymorpha rutila TaxID=446787 RepID=A0A852ZGW7_9ACTN|nr:hypothetical protein [Actinopolymorpha rutila]
MRPGLVRFDRRSPGAENLAHAATSTADRATDPRFARGSVTLMLWQGIGGVLSLGHRAGLFCAWHRLAASGYFLIKFSGLIHCFTRRPHSAGSGLTDTRGKPQGCCGPRVAPGQAVGHPSLGGFGQELTAEVSLPMPRRREVLGRSECAVGCRLRRRLARTMANTDSG